MFPLAPFLDEHRAHLKEVRGLCARAEAEYHRLLGEKKHLEHAVKLLQSPEARRLTGAIQTAQQRLALAGERQRPAWEEKLSRAEEELSRFLKRINER